MKRKQKSQLCREEKLLFFSAGSSLCLSLSPSHAKASRGGIIEWGDPVGERGAGKAKGPAACSVNCLELGNHVPVESSTPLMVLLGPALRAHRTEAGHGPLSSQRLADKCRTAQSSKSKWISRSRDECDEGARVIGDRRL